MVTFDVLGAQGGPGVIYHSFGRPVFCSIFSIWEVLHKRRQKRIKRMRDQPMRRIASQSKALTTRRCR